MRGWKISCRKLGSKERCKKTIASHEPVPSLIIKISTSRSDWLIWKHFFKPIESLLLGITKPWWNFYSVRIKTYRWLSFLENETFFHQHGSSRPRWWRRNAVFCIHFSSLFFSPSSSQTDEDKAAKSLSLCGQKIMEWLRCFSRNLFYRYRLSFFLISEQMQVFWTLFLQFQEIWYW